MIQFVIGVSLFRIFLNTKVVKLELIFGKQLLIKLITIHDLEK
jgi:hypothetical protein